MHPGPTIEIKDNSHLALPNGKEMPHASSQLREKLNANDMMMMMMMMIIMMLTKGIAPSPRPPPPTI